MTPRPNVRKLMAWVAVAACSLGWWVPSRVQRDAVAAIERAGGRVAYGWDLLDTGLPKSDGRRWCPGWLIDAVGPDYLSTARRMVVEGRDSGPRVEPDDLARLGGLKWLVIHAPMSDDDLARLGGLTRLRRLDITDSPVDDAGLAHLQGLRDLRALDLAGKRVTDAGVDRLAGLRSLRSVDLRRTGVTGAGIDRLRSLRPDLAVRY